MISLLATASSALMVSPSARVHAQRCGEVRMAVAPGTKLLVIGGNGYVGREVHAASPSPLPRLAIPTWCLLPAASLSHHCLSRRPP